MGGLRGGPAWRGVSLEERAGLESVLRGFDGIKDLCIAIVGFCRRLQRWPVTSAWNSCNAREGKGEIQ